MRTTFTDSEDKLLVQIAYQFEREGLRVTWNNVARRMKIKRDAKELRLRLSSLKRTDGKSIKAFRLVFLVGCLRDHIGQLVERASEGEEAGLDVQPQASSLTPVRLVVTSVMA
ncbi:hypothetical protein JG688_00010836 [Phytophthora aleatoria]|uniref:Myb-like domain-containing protein n=1 Tax=Phytophthora aleatoria TaxID=2496075 RepID=A0A8J5M1E3_9STRA|nr:hypothetical protein JG688_00010836 [Phytophthora aleatoria]